MFVRGTEEEFVAEPIPWLFYYFLTPPSSTALSGV